ncbi:TerB family tellurite resistance protein [Cystobacter fuscus]|uniref:tellurite resistance TerB family protein n=1 Tax=Cystobacter fuscus TaxID=43 RepID=UPI002B2E2D67|nr:TerB family tellurite resistance protein [Cystobacter fuscus]
MSQITADDRFNIEVLKLMIQLAWSDGRLDARESGLIQGVARSWNVPELEFAALKKLLAHGGTPPAPDLALLRDRPDEVFEAVRALIASDGQLRAEEKELIEELRVILGQES